MKLFKQLLCLLLSLSLLIATPIGIMAENEEIEEGSVEDIITCSNCGYEGEYENWNVDGGTFICPECGVEEGEEEAEEKTDEEEYYESDVKTDISDDVISVAGKNVTDPTIGLNWLSDQAALNKLVADNQPEDPDAKDVYDLVRSAAVMYVGKNKAYIWGLELLVDPDDETVMPFVDDGTTYAPFQFLSDSLELSVAWEEDNRTATLSTDTKTLQVTAGSTAALVDGKEETLAAPPTVKDGKIYLPVRAIAEIFDKKLYYKEGLIVIGSEDVIDAITEEQIDYLLAEDMVLEREKAFHPYSAPNLRWSMQSSARSAINLSGEALEEQLAPYIQTSYYNLATQIDESMSAYNNIIMSPRPSHEIVTAQIAKKYVQTGDEDLALRAIIMLYHSALAYYGNGLSRDTSEFSRINVVTYRMPATLFYAYDQVHNSPMWEVFNEGYQTDAKKVIANSYLELYHIYREEMFVTGRPEGNYPACMTASAGLAVALDRPDMVREVMKMVDISSQDDRFYADGMWYEGSFDYGTQTTGNFKQVGRVLTSYVDPVGYKDSTSEDTFRGYIDFAKRWPVLNGMSALSQAGYYPDGSRIHLNDTNYNTLAKTAEDPIDPARLESNIEMNHFGFYGLKYGNSEEAQQLNLQIPVVNNVSHQHNAYLGLSYYSAGMEVLPDIGYVKSSAGYRYSYTGYYGHNMAWADSKLGSGTSDGSKFARPNVYLYDDGSTNGKQVQVLEGANLLPPEANIEMNRRMLLMIATDENHSYAVDIQRIRGNTLHESFLQQVQEEDVELETSLELDPAYDGQISDYLRSQGITGGAMHDSFSKIITAHQGKRTGEGFWFTYKGKTSGTTLKAFIKGDDDKLVVFSTEPTPRRAKNDSTKRDDFPGYHFYQSVGVTPKDTTIFGAVYEGYRKNETAKVRNVTWYDPEDNDDETAMLAVELKDFIDYIYISNDTKPRQLGEFTFSTDAVAAVRVSKISGRVVWGYIYGEGSITSEDYELIGKENQSYQVLSTQGSRYGEIPNQIKVRGVPTEDIAGLWGNVSFSDGSGTAFRVEGVNQSVITVHNWPAFSVAEDGATFLSYPQYEDKEKGIVSDWGVAWNYYDENAAFRTREGTVTFTIKRPTFYKARACDIYY